MKTINPITHDPQLGGALRSCTKSFDECRACSKLVVNRYERIKEIEPLPGYARQWLAKKAQQIAASLGSAKRIASLHHAVIRRQPKWRLQDRSDIAVVMLLMALDAPWLDHKRRADIAALARKSQHEVETSAQINEQGFQNETH